jgi:transcriptional regulator with PAS, ATPase and Fis domain
MSSHNSVYDEEGEIYSLDIIEMNHIKKVLDEFNWNRELTAKALGIAQKTLYSKIKKYNLR